jgi:hypothetical protein
LFAFDAGVGIFRLLRFRFRILDSFSELLTRPTLQEKNVNRFGHRLAVAAAVLLMAVTGCSGDKTKTVSGKITLPANAKLIETDTIELLFASTEAGGKSYPANVSSKDLSFTAKVPPGKYRVQVAVKTYPGEKESQKRSQEFEALNTGFGSGTPLNYEVTGDATQKITVDLGKKSVAKE